jgi:hypothetical protein
MTQVPRDSSVTTADPAREEDAPLSISQHRQVLLEDYCRLTRRPRPSFNLVSWMRVRGSLDVTVLARAANLLIGRHAALRSVLRPAIGVSDDLRREAAERLGRTGIIATGTHAQSVRRVATADLRTREIGGWPEERQNAFLVNLIADEFATPFDYGVAPLMRLQVIRVSFNENVVIMAWPHFAVDAISKQVCQRDLWRLYEVGAAQAPREAASVPQYPAFARQQLERLQTGKFAGSADYWRQQWAAFGDAEVSPEELPGAFPVASPLGSSIQSLPINAHTTKRLRELARVQRVTLFTICFAAYAALLHGLTGRARLGVWVPFANRLQPGADCAVGWFAQAHMVGVDLETSQSWSDLIGHCAAQIRGALLHHELPLGALQSTLAQSAQIEGRTRRIRSQPLLMFDWHAPRTHSDPPGLAVGPVPGLNLTGIPIARELNMKVLDVSGSLTITLMYGTGMFREADARRMLARYRKVLDVLSDNGQAVIPRNWLRSLRSAHKL